MFGYVLPPLRDLPEEEARFRRVYCGLCHTLGRRYGLSSRFILNYDFTFLSILLSGPEEGPCVEGRCPAHPLRRRAYLDDAPPLELAADESVILAYWQARDGASDGDGLKYRAAVRLLEGAYRKASSSRPGFDALVRRQLDLLHELERARCDSIDRTADAFATLLAGAAPAGDPVRRRVLEQLLYHLGRWIYLVDAADDLGRDHDGGRYNPVALRYGLTDGKWTDAARHAFAGTLDQSIHRMTTAFELWDFGVWRTILERTLYTGLFCVGRAVLDGTFRTMRRIPPQRETKDSEETT